MSKGIVGKNNWALVLLLLVGVVLGGLIGKLCAGVPALLWSEFWIYQSNGVRSGDSGSDIRIYG